MVVKRDEDVNRLLKVGTDEEEPAAEAFLEGRGFGGEDGMDTADPVADLPRGFKDGERKRLLLIVHEL
jgi:hypothetical protein